MVGRAHCLCHSISFLLLIPKVERTEYVAGVKQKHLQKSLASPASGVSPDEENRGLFLSVFAKLFPLREAAEAFDLPVAGLEVAIAAGAEHNRRFVRVFYPVAVFLKRLAGPARGGAVLGGVEIDFEVLFGVHGI
jgi:hypothetical protein